MMAFLSYFPKREEKLREAGGGVTAIRAKAALG